ncbi:hypothetical protein C3495_08870 [Clostridiaceae bacterium 14S0207]|nr:hypothetical protein C3495_08870 [Clostridiaceae bacterium 14S0207]
MIKKALIKKNPINLLIAIIFLAFIFSNKNIFIKKIRSDNSLPEKIYNFMKYKENRIKIFNKAIALNNGSSCNTCVYFVSEVLRNNNIDIDTSTCNTHQLIDILEENNFKKEKDYKKLKPGNICFTTDEYLNTEGIPSHTYIFMGWEKENNYSYAYICDNQAKDYKNKIYHLRNIKNHEILNNKSKEPFSFFMYK